MRGDGWSSRAIEGFGGGWPSHMANLLADGNVWDARDDLVKYKGAVYPRGVQLRPASYLHEQYSKWIALEAPEGSEKLYEAWVDVLATQVGKPYDSVGILDFAEGIITGRYEDRNYAPVNPEQSKAWFCDEYATWAAQKVGLIPSLPYELPVFTLTPGAALNLFIGAGWKVVGAKG